MRENTTNTEWRRTRERRLLRRSLVFYGWTSAGFYALHCLQTWRVEFVLAFETFAIVVVATALHVLAGLNPPDAIFWRGRRSGRHETPR